MIREELSQKIAAALASLVASGRLPAADYGTPEIADTKNPEHGDYACNIALTASKKAGMNPRDFGALLLEALAGDADLSAELAGPGFLNLRLRPQFISDYVARILSAGTSLARSPSSGKKINVEYVSVNPNGPITVGSGRGAAFGSCLANVLEAAGNAVHREYYINDGVNSEQMRLFAESVKSLIDKGLGAMKAFPEKGYKGAYVEEVGHELLKVLVAVSSDPEGMMQDEDTRDLLLDNFLTARGKEMRKSHELLRYWVELLPVFGEEVRALLDETRYPDNYEKAEILNILYAYTIVHGSKVLTPKQIRQFFELMLIVLQDSQLEEWLQERGRFDSTQFKEYMWHAVVRVIAGHFSDFLSHGAYWYFAGVGKLPASWHGISDEEVLDQLIRDKFGEHALDPRMRGNPLQDLGFQGMPGHPEGLDGRLPALAREMALRLLNDLTEVHLLDEDPSEEQRLAAEEARSAAVDTSWYQRHAQALMLAKQRSDLATFGVEFDTWFSEQSLHDQKAVDACLQELLDKQVADDEPYRLVLKMAKGGKIEEVERQVQPIEEEDEQGAADPLPNPPAQAGEGTTGTVWLRSTKFADDMDRVLRRRDGRLTYIASDVAYHRDKLTDASGVRGTGPVDKMITILGPDHHGYIGRLTAVVAALLEKTDPVPLATSRRTEDSDAGESRLVASGTGELSEIEAQIYRSPEERDACLAALQEAKEKLEVVIFQIVRFVKEGKPAPMRKRDGNIYALIDLVDELGKAMAPDADKTEQQRIGRDVARFFYLMRSHETHMDFDIDLATKQSDENPVFYVQYAHARICSVIDKAKEAGISADYASADFSLLQDPRELALIKKILDLPFEIRRCAEDYGVHRLTTFAVELARTYHHFYDGCRVVQTDQPALSQARMALCEAARIGLKGVFDILGISAPERMERTVEPTS